MNHETLQALIALRDAAETLRSAGGSFEVRPSGRKVWRHNPALAMPEEEQYKQNVGNR